MSKKWATPMLDSKKMRPGTVKSYLCSLAKFFEFLVDGYDTGLASLPNLGQELKGKLEQMVRRVKGWRSSISRLYETERWEKIIEDSRNAIPPDDAKNITTSKPAMKAKQLLVKCTDQKVSLTEFVSIRDYLIARLGLENGQRPGPLEAARLRDFQTAESDGKGGYVMYVARHKTSKAGPAPISMKNNLHKQVVLYVKHVRSAYVNKDVQELFITTSGNAFNDGTIGKRITEWWRKAQGKKVTSTALRKNDCLYAS